MFKLIKWYLDHSMRVTKIYQVVETCQNKCFKECIDEMVEGGREAHVNLDEKLWGLYTSY